MQNTTHRCIECGSQATHIITDGINNIFRMEQVYFPCGAIQTSSYVARWQAGTVFHEGCLAVETKLNQECSITKSQGDYIAAVKKGDDCEKNG